MSAWSAPSLSTLAIPKSPNFTVWWPLTNIFWDFKSVIKSSIHNKIFGENLRVEPWISRWWSVVKCSIKSVYLTTWYACSATKLIDWCHPHNVIPIIYVAYHCKVNQLIKGSYHTLYSIFSENKEWFALYQLWMV